MTLISIIVGVISQNLEKSVVDMKTQEENETVQTSELFRAATMRRVLENFRHLEKKTRLWKTLIIIINISHDKTWTWLRKGNFNRETKSLLIAAQNNAVRTNHIKVRIDKTQQNSKCRLCGDRDETINHIISECSKLAQKEYKTRHDWVGKVIHWEMC